MNLNFRGFNESFGPTSTSTQVMDSQDANGSKKSHKKKKKQDHNTSCFDPKVRKSSRCSGVVKHDYVFPINCTYVLFAGGGGEVC